MIVGTLIDGFEQPHHGSVCVIKMRLISADTPGFGRAIQIDNAGIYAIVDMNWVSDTATLTTVRIRANFFQSVISGSVVNSGAEVRSLSPEEIRNLSDRLCSSEGISGALRSLADIMRTMQNDVPRRPYARSDMSVGYNLIPRSASPIESDMRIPRYQLRAPDDDQYWRGECDRLFRDLIHRTPEIRDSGLVTESADNVLEVTRSESNLTWYELAQSLQHSEPSFDIEGVPWNPGHVVVRRLRFDRPVYRIYHPTDYENPLALQGFGYRVVDFPDSSFFQRHFGNPRSSGVPTGCRGCANLHGKSYAGSKGRNMFVCAMHPNGYDGEGRCPDRED